MVWQKHSSEPIALYWNDLSNARAVIRRVYDVCATQAGEKGVLLSLDLPADPMPLVADGVQMQRALINLVNNAIEASSAGQPVALLAARGHKGLVIQIRDHGPGMDSEVLEKLFTPFFTTKRGGTGLGIGIVRKIIEAHKGTIRIESKQGAGTDVIIELPYKD
ncbi:MAG TPA: HAMP domain-containing sensor histidine kinase [Nitrospirota bacterium]|nr:HAMP domain-containing sensor histidine kinase [Nitrospirota bacterium]